MAPNLLTSQWFEMNEERVDAEDLQEGKLGAGGRGGGGWVGGDEGQGEVRGVGGSLLSLSVGGLRLVEVAGPAVGVVVRHVHGRSVQVEVPTS